MGVILEKMTAKSQSLAKQDGKFSQLETDLLRKQCIDLYDLINQLHLVNAQDKYAEPKIEVSPFVAVDKAIPDSINSGKPEDAIVESKKALEETKITEPPAEPELMVLKPAEPIKEQKPEMKSPKFIPVVEEPSIENRSKNKSEIEIKVAEVVDPKSKATLHESLNSSKEENELAHRFVNSKINKIKEAIDISKRFEMQSVLFGDDSNAYNISMSELEMAGSRESAFELFKRFEQRYKWAHDHPLTLELKSLIYRKFH